MLSADIFDEMYDSGGRVRRPYRQLQEWLESQSSLELRQHSRRAEEIFRQVGITFNVYGHEDATERLIPFDLIPRIIENRLWRKIERGVTQRVRALNAFLADLYDRQEILRAGIIPERLVLNNASFLPQMVGVRPPKGIYTHVVGVDLVRTDADEVFVLEDNARVPSGVSYILQDRETMSRILPELMNSVDIHAVEDYPRRLLRALQKSIDLDRPPNIGLLTPGVMNSAFFEHAFLAEQMGIELVVGSDLVVDDGRAMLRTTRGLVPVDVLYRRIDDDFLDPLTFNEKSLLGAPGLFDVYRNGRLALCNAPGTGIADDKAVYSYLPEVIKFYLGQTPILPNVETWRCAEPDSLRYVLDNLERLVVKEVHASGGYGMLIGSTSTRRERAEFARKLKARPSNYIAQPVLNLSTVPTVQTRGIAGRHVDLRPFVILSPEDVYVTPGGLTRVALRKGSLVVNSSQGGGTKDTWVLRD